MPLGRINHTQPLANHPLNVGRAVWLHMLPGRLSGNRLQSLVGGHHADLLFGPSIRASRFPGASCELHFDGVDDRYRCSVAGLGLTTDTPLTIAAWGWSNSLAQTGPIVGLFSSTSNSQHFDLYFAGHEAADNIACYHEGTGGAQTSVLGPTYEVRRRYRVMGVLKSTASRELYVDGRLVGSGTVNMGAAAALDRFAGGLHDRLSQANPLNGGGYDFCLWNRALSAADALEDYQQSLAGYPDVLNRVRSSRLVSIPAGGPFPHHVRRRLAGGMVYPRGGVV